MLVWSTIVPSRGATFHLAFLPKKPDASEDSVYLILVCLTCIKIHETKAMDSPAHATTAAPSPTEPFSRVRQRSLRSLPWPPQRQAGIANTARLQNWLLCPAVVMPGPREVRQLHTHREEH